MNRILAALGVGSTLVVATLLLPGTVQLSDSSAHAQTGAGDPTTLYSGGSGTTPSNGSYFRAVANLPVPAGTTRVRLVLSSVAGIQDDVSLVCADSAGNPISDVIDARGAVGFDQTVAWPASCPNIGVWIRANNGAMGFSGTFTWALYTNAPLLTATPTSTPTAIRTPTATTTPTPQPTDTPPPTPRPTNTPTSTPTDRPTPPPTATATPTATVTTCEVLVRIDGQQQWISKPASFCQAGV